MGYIDRFQGNLDRLREGRSRLEDHMRRLGILEPPQNPTSAGPQSQEMRVLLEEFNLETNRILMLVSDLSQAF